MLTHYLKGINFHKFVGDQRTVYINFSIETYFILQSEPLTVREDLHRKTTEKIFFFSKKTVVKWLSDETKRKHS